MEPQTDRIDAKISYTFHFTLYPGDTHEVARTAMARVRAALQKGACDYLYSDAPEAAQHPAFRDLQVAESFLHGGGLPFACTRVLFPARNIGLSGVDVTDSAVMLTVFDEVNIAQLTIHLSVRGADTDTMVYLRHLQYNPTPLFTQNGVPDSIPGIFEAFCARVGSPHTDLQQTYLAEINAFLGYGSLSQALEEQPQRIYGLLCGDEGWPHVPESLARMRLQSQWGSRSFIRVISFGDNFLFFHLQDSPEAQAYLAHQRRFGQTFYGGVNPYFLLDAPLAGINHGILFSMEIVMVIKSIASRILNQHAAFQKAQSGNFSRQIRRTKAYRRELITTLNRVENIGMSELGELETIMLNSQHITPIVEKIKYLLELLESELDLMYQNRTNTLVNILTVAGLLLSVVGIVLAEL